MGPPKGGKNDADLQQQDVLQAVVLAPTRELAMQLYGEDAPGPGAYQAAESQKKQYPQVDPNISVFRSGSLQRPKNDTPVPGSGTYSPNMASVYANQRDSGAQMRSAGSRFRHK